MRRDADMSIARSGNALVVSRPIESPELSEDEHEGFPQFWQRFYRNNERLFAEDCLPLDARHPGPPPHVWLIRRQQLSPPLPLDRTYPPRPPAPARNANQQAQSSLPREANISERSARQPLPAFTNVLQPACEPVMQVSSPSIDDAPRTPLRKRITRKPVVSPGTPPPRIKRSATPLPPHSPPRLDLDGRLAPPLKRQRTTLPFPNLDESQN